VTESIPENAPLEHAAGLRRASDEFMQRLDRLYELESRKRELPPDEAEFVRLAREIEDLSRALLFVGGEQVELAEGVHADLVDEFDRASEIHVFLTPGMGDQRAVASSR